MNRNLAPQIKVPYSGNIPSPLWEDENRERTSLDEEVRETFDFKENAMTKPIEVLEKYLQITEPKNILSKISSFATFNNYKRNVVKQILSEKYPLRAERLNHEIGSLRHNAYSLMTDHLQDCLLQIEGRIYDEIAKDSYSDLAVKLGQIESRSKGTESTAAIFCRDARKLAIMERQYELLQEKMDNKYN